MLGLLVIFLGRLWFDAGGAYLLARDPWAAFRLSVWREVFSTVDSIPLLAYSSGLALLLAIALAVTVARIPIVAIGRAIWLGLRSSLLPVSVLVLAWSLKGVCADLQTGRFLADILADAISPLVFPALVFVTASLTSFATGTSFGTMAILIPTAIPLAFRIDGDYGLITMMSIGAILDGAIFGDHCSPISDTTIMSSIASSCDHLAHVRSQIPYSLTVAALALGAGYLPVAMGIPNWVGILGSAAFSAVLFLTLRARRSIPKAQP